jgi:hypothetical protein
MSKWQTMETAPKDGTWLLMHGYGDGLHNAPFIGQWKGGAWRRVHDDLSHKMTPLYWQPIDPPPQWEGVEK